MSGYKLFSIPAFFTEFIELDVDCQLDFLIALKVSFMEGLKSQALFVNITYV